MLPIHRADLPLTIGLASSLFRCASWWWNMEPKRHHHHHHHHQQQRGVTNRLRYVHGGTNILLRPQWEERGGLLCITRVCLSLTIIVLPTGVLFESTGTWNQNGTATINMAISINTGSSGYGMCVARQSALGCLPLTIRLPPCPSGVYFYRSVTATWNQNGAVTITTQSTGSSGYGTCRCVTNALPPHGVGEGSIAQGTCLLATHRHVGPLPPSGMYFDGGGTWNQNGAVIITTMGTEGYGKCRHAGCGGGHGEAHTAVCHSPLGRPFPTRPGVCFDGGGTWNQNGAASTVRSAGVGTCVAGPMHCASADWGRSL
jgi:hypothetical protein